MPAYGPRDSRRSSPVRVGANGGGGGSSSNSSSKDRKSRDGAEWREARRGTPLDAPSSLRPSFQEWEMRQVPSHLHRSSAGSAHWDQQPRRASMPEVETLRSAPSVHDGLRPQAGPAPPRGAKPPAFYLPPPGYPYDGVPQPSWNGPSDPTPIYGGQGSWHRLDNGAMAWLPTGDSRPPTRWVEDNILPALSHSDWTVPQAKQVLASWATLATLLAGTQATLLSYYHQLDGGTFAVYGLASAGLCLEVYGALLASITIVCSISFQAPDAPKAEHHRGVFGLHASGFTSSRRTLSSPGGAPQPSMPRNVDRKPLTARTAAVLDRLALTCGYLIVAGAICELASLAAYSTLYQENSVTIAMGVTLGLCGLATFLAATLGFLHGTESQRFINAARAHTSVAPSGSLPSAALSSARTAVGNAHTPMRFQQRGQPQSAGFHEPVQRKHHLFSRVKAHSDESDSEPDRPFV
ncbi:hypothetical protein FA10DRAFT_123960 [Acaromyces ingoldii]|uniref:Transmembrane protein n=1 Tax=Acaromyces ingoldii TaxID=215250 RepID=A0A316YP43_9BASI|nr:hypothetical protein FA10DRAFT_123960 [Acaromyces ingoldii]PWN90796.1 hypothetical protein FA10DRAFT_123960 [Acaromyces ingoldii]